MSNDGAVARTRESRLAAFEFQYQVASSTDALRAALARSGKVRIPRPDCCTRPLCRSRCGTRAGVEIEASLGAKNRVVSQPRSAASSLAIRVRYQNRTGELVVDQTQAVAALNAARVETEKELGITVIMEKWIVSQSAINPAFDSNEREREDWLAARRHLALDTRSRRLKPLRSSSRNKGSGQGAAVGPRGHSKQASPITTRHCSLGAHQNGS